MRKTTPQGRSHIDRHGHAVDKGKNIEYHAAFCHWIDRIVRVFGYPCVRTFDVRLITCPLSLDGAIIGNCRCYATIIDHHRMAGHGYSDMHGAWLDRIRHSKVAEEVREPERNAQVENEGISTIPQVVRTPLLARLRESEMERCDLQ